MRVKPQDADDFSSGDIKSYGGIYAATARDFAEALECDPEAFIQHVLTSEIEPLTAVGDEDDPDRFNLSFERDEFERLKTELQEQGLTAS